MVLLSWVCFGGVVIGLELYFDSVLRFMAGRDDSGTRMEVLELDVATHPYFVATQYHPEYISRPLKPSAPYLGLILASAGKLNSYLNNSMCSNSTSEDGENSGEERDGSSLSMAP